MDRCRLEIYSNHPRSMGGCYLGITGINPEAVKWGVDRYDRLLCPGLQPGPPSQTPGGLGQRYWTVSEVMWPPQLELRRWRCSGPSSVMGSMPPGTHAWRHSAGCISPFVTIYSHLLDEQPQINEFKRFPVLKLFAVPCLNDRLLFSNCYLCLWPIRQHTLLRNWEIDGICHS